MVFDLGCSRNACPLNFELQTEGDNMIDADNLFQIACRINSISIGF